MKSGLRQLARNAKSKKSKGNGPGIPLAPYGYRRGMMFDLGTGRMSKETQLRTYQQSGTVYGIVSLLQLAAASPPWHLYKKQPLDGRRRYTTADGGSDQRVEVVNHAALTLWNKPNYFTTGFEFREGCNQHEELTGETFWVLEREVANFPTSMWYVRPDRMDPVPDPDDYLVGWIYTGPNGQQVPLKLSEVIQEKLPDPLDPFRGASAVGSIMPNIEQQLYATEYQRNLFYNGADPGGIINVPTKLTEPEFDELIDRWRETHQGVARAGRVGVLENGTSWIPNAHTNKDLEYANLRLTNRDEIREAWRMHKAMLGTSEDVNRANAQTAEEVFVSWQTTPRLERRKNTLNSKYLPMFGEGLEDKLEFDYEDPNADNRELDNMEMQTKAQAANLLISTGFDPDDVLEAVGLPSMFFKAPITPKPLPVEAPPSSAGGIGVGTPESDSDKQLNDILSNLRRNAAFNAIVGG
jgi:HK97 family phage portal protein